jgi:hypothetical protein
MRLIPLLFLAACSPLISRPEGPALRFQPLPPPPAPTDASAWHATFADADAAAKERGRPMLLCFTAKW